MRYISTGKLTLGAMMGREDSNEVGIVMFHDAPK